MGIKNLQSLARILLICTVFFIIGLLALKMRSKVEPEEFPDKEIIPARETMVREQKVKMPDEEVFSPTQETLPPTPVAGRSIVPPESRRFSGGDEVIPPPPITYRTADQRPVMVTEDSSDDSSDISLELKGVVTVDDDSYAIIRDSKSGKDRIYHVNDVIQNSRITEISRNGIVLEADNGSQSIPMFEDNSRAESDGTIDRSGTGRTFGPAHVNGPPPPDPTKSSLGEDVARRLPAMIRRKER